MRVTSSKDTARDWSYSDQFLDHAKRIIGEQLLVASPLEIDCKEATDLILKVSGRGDVAFRVRRPANLEKFGWDITFRSTRIGFEKTELDKVLEGHARWFLYGFGGGDGRTMCRWVMLDLNVFRSMLARGILVRPQTIWNSDGTGFEAFDIRRLKGLDPAVIFAASEDVPSVIIPKGIEPRFFRKRAAFGKIGE